MRKPAGAGLVMLKTTRENVPRQNSRFWGFVKGANSSSALFLAKLVEVESIGASRGGGLEKPPAGRPCFVRTGQRCKELKMR
jgi:hypothetical protein